MRHGGRESESLISVISVNLCNLCASTPVRSKVKED
mgnify:CR=1 FL=1